MRKPILLFDLGGTLVDYFARGQFTPTLHEAIRQVAEELRAAGHPVPPEREIALRVAAENHQSRNHRVRPLHPRLARIFPLPSGADAQLMPAMIRAFMGPIFAVARRYDDTLDALSSWRQRGYRIGILSNAPWGTPPRAWHEELVRHGLAERCDLALFCGEVGWRKPRPARCSARPWLTSPAVRKSACSSATTGGGDVYGARRAGITPLLIDRTGSDAHGAQPALRSLADLEPMLQRWDGASGRGTGAAGAAGASRA